MRGPFERCINDAKHTLHAERDQKSKQREPDTEGEIRVERAGHALIESLHGYTAVIMSSRIIGIES